MQKNSLLARVAERVLVREGKSNLMTGEKTWFQYYLELYYMQVLKVEETVCRFFKNGVACSKSS